MCFRYQIKAIDVFKVEGKICFSSTLFQGCGCDTLDRLRTFGTVHLYILKKLLDEYLPLKISPLNYLISLGPIFC